MPVSSDCLSISAGVEGKVRNRWGKETENMQPLLAGGARPLPFPPSSLPAFHPSAASCSQSLGGAGDRGSVTGSHCPLQNPQAHSPAKEVPTGPTRPASQQEIGATCWWKGAMQQMTVAEPSA